MSDWWISPVDGHRHALAFGDRPDDCAVCAVAAERDRLREQYDEVVGHNNEFARTCAAHVAERDRLRAVVAEYQRTHHALDHALDDDQVDDAMPAMREWQAAQQALLDMPTGDAKEGT